VGIGSRISLGTVRGAGVWLLACCAAGPVVDRTSDVQCPNSQSAGDEGCRRIPRKTDRKIDGCGLCRVVSGRDAAALGQGRSSSKAAAGAEGVTGKGPARTGPCAFRDASPGGQACSLSDWQMRKVRDGQVPGYRPLAPLLPTKHACIVPFRG
jgi:hypothetical protein